MPVFRNIGVASRTSIQLAADLSRCDRALAAAGSATAGEQRDIELRSCQARRGPGSGRRGRFVEAMYRNLVVSAVIPAHNEQDNIGAVVSDLLALRTETGGRVVDEVIVCDNASTDATEKRAKEAGGRVVFEPTSGYGIACQAAIQALGEADAVLFIDGDQAFHARQALDLLAALEQGADLVVGSRAQGRMEPGALSMPQRLGNRLASLLIRVLWAGHVTDLGPFRVIRRESLRSLDMCNASYGWTVEMQVKAIRSGMTVVEVPVDTRARRFGRSKVGGTLRGVVGASIGILGTIFRLWFQQARSRRGQ